MAVAILGDTGRSPMDSLDDFAGFYFDIALSSGAAALPSLLAFAKPGHITFGLALRSGCGRQAVHAGLETPPGLDADARTAIERSMRFALPRPGQPPSDASSAVDREVR
jgi:hypothetical protein